MNDFLQLLDDRQAELQKAYDIAIAKRTALDASIKEIQAASRELGVIRQRATTPIIDLTQ